MSTRLAQIIEIRELAPGVRSFILGLEEGAGSYRYLPGQWLDLHIEIDGQEKIGGYSLYPPPHSLPPPRSLLPHSHHVCIAVKKSGHPVATYLHEKARALDFVRISEGQGPCFYNSERDAGLPLILIAGGIGITPLFCIFSAACEDAQEVQLVYSFRASQCLLKDEISELLKKNKRAKVVFRDTEKQGRIDPDVLKSLNLPQSAVVYLCGPRSMIDELSDALKILGYGPEQIRFEKWW